MLLADWMATDTDDLDDVADYLADYSGEFDDAAEYDAAALATAATGDRGILLALAAEAETVTPDNTDPKLAALVEELADIAAEADSQGGADARDKRKVLVFSYFADTVDWISDRFLNVVEHDERLAGDRFARLRTEGQ